MGRRTSKYNDHWEFVRKTFRQVYLVRSFAKVSNRIRANCDIDTAAVTRMFEDARQRRNVFLRKILVEAAFIGKTLGIDRSGMCIRHPKQLICKFPHFESTAKYQEKLPPVVNFCRICRSDASEEGGGRTRGHQPAMVNTIGEVQELQSDRKEWKESTSILGMERKPYDVGDDEPSSSDIDSDETGHKIGFESDDVLLQADWVEYARFRILQVCSWEDRFALKNHHIFCHYFKMLQFGVAIDAVKFAIQTDGYHPSIMDLAPNVPLELQVNQLVPDALENLRLKGAITKETGKDEASLDDDLALDGLSTEVNIEEKISEFLSVVRRRRSNQIFAISSILDVNEYARRQEKNKSQNISFTSRRQEQSKPGGIQNRRKPKSNVGQSLESTVPIHPSPTSELEVVGQLVGDYLKSSQKRKGREHRHSQSSQTTSRTTNKSDRQRSESKRSSDKLIKKDSQRGTVVTGTSGIKHHRNPRTSKPKSDSGREHRQKTGPEQSPSKTRSTVTDKSSNSGQERRGSRRISWKDSPERKYNSEKQLRTVNSPEVKRRKSQSMSRLLDISGHKDGSRKKYSSAETVSIVKDAKDRKGSETAPRVHRDTTSLANEMPTNETSVSQDTENVSPNPVGDREGEKSNVHLAMAKEGDKVSRNTPNDRRDTTSSSNQKSTTETTVSQGTANISPKAGGDRKKQKNNAMIAMTKDGENVSKIAPEVHKSTSSLPKKMSTTTTSVSQDTTNAMPKPISEREKKTIGAPIPTIKDGKVPAKVIESQSSIMEKEEGPPSKISLAPAKNEKKLRNKARKSEKKSFIDRVFQIIRRPGKKTGSSFKKKKRNEAKHQNNKDQPKDQLNDQPNDQPNPSPRSKSKSKSKLKKESKKKPDDSKNISSGLPVMEVLYSNQPEKVSPLNTKLKLKLSSKLKENTQAMSSEPMSVDNRVNISASKGDKINHTSIASIRANPSAATSAAKMENVQFDRKSDKAKGSAAINYKKSHVDFLGDLGDLEKEKLNLENEQNASVKNEKVHDMREDIRTREQTINDLLRQELKRKDSIINNLRNQIKEMHDDANRRRNKAIHDSVKQGSPETKNSNQIAGDVRAIKGNSIPHLQRKEDGKLPSVPDLNVRSQKSEPASRRVIDEAGREKIKRGKTGDINQGDVDEGLNYELILLDCIQKLRSIEDDENDDSYEFQWS